MSCYIRFLIRIDGSVSFARVRALSRNRAGIWKRRRCCCDGRVGARPDWAGVAESMGKVDVWKVLKVEFWEAVQDGTHINRPGRRRRRRNEAMSRAKGLKTLVSSAVKLESSEREFASTNSAAEAVV